MRPIFSDLSERKSMQWLSNEIKNLPNFGENNLTERVTMPPLCELVLFEYEAQVGNVHGYFDKFPLVLVVRPLENDRFFGFNLHYIDKETRTKILKPIHDIKISSLTNRKLANQRIYPFLDSLVKSKIEPQAYKQYTLDNIISNVITLQPKSYHHVAHLPIATLKENNRKGI